MKLTFDDVAAALESSSFQFARTMPHVPHWYTLRKNWSQPVEFEDVVQFIRDHGKQIRWGKYNHFYLQVNEWKYWTMGSALEKTILINRDAHGLKAQYDEIADVYDELTSDLPRHWGELFDYNGGSVLDIGAGTGNLLGQVWPDRYLAVEPSYKMIDRLRRKHPTVATVAAPLHRFYTAERFDYVVAMRGSASYLMVEELERVRSFLKPGGRYYLMFYAPEVEPLHYAKTETTLVHFKHGRDVLPGDVSERGPYFIIQGTA